MLEWEQSSQQFQSDTLCSVTALRAKWLYIQPKTAVLTSEELRCSDMTPVWKHAGVLCFQMTAGVFWLTSIHFFFFFVNGSVPTFQEDIAAVCQGLNKSGDRLY